MAKLYTIEATVHKPVPKGYRVKVSLLDFGMYINGAVVQPPNDEHAEWWVFPPSQHIGHGKYIKLLEFNRKLPLWQEMSEASIDATKLYISQQDVVLEDITDGPIDFDDIPPFK